MVRSSEDRGCTGKACKDSFLSPSCGWQLSLGAPLLPNPPVFPSPLLLGASSRQKFLVSFQKGDLEVSLSLIFE